MIILFKTPKGEIIKGKVAFCEHVGVSTSYLQNRLNDSNEFYIKGKLYTYEYASRKDYVIKKREPSSFYFNKRKIAIIENVNKKFVFNDHCVTEFSTKTGKKVLLKTYSLSYFEKYLTNIFYFICPRLNI